MNHAELRAAAEAATPGPWDYDAGTRGIEGQAYSLTYPMAEITGWVPKENALYIALASPDVVLGLLDENAKLRDASIQAVQLFEWLAGFNGEPEHRCPSVMQLVGHSIDLRDVLTDALEDADATHGQVIGGRE